MVPAADLAGCRARPGAEGTVVIERGSFREIRLRSDKAVSQISMPQQILIIIYYYLNKFCTNFEE